MRLWLTGLLVVLVSACSNEADRSADARERAAGCVSGDRCWAASANGQVSQAEAFPGATHCKRPQDFALVEEHFDGGEGIVFLTCAPDGRHQFVFGIHMQPDAFGGSNFTVSHAECPDNRCRSVMAIVGVG
jgi:hypothetical protein